MIADRILAEMESVRNTLGRSEGGLFRASAVTLIMLGEDGDGGAAADIAEIERRHPNRSVIVQLGEFAEPFEYRVVAQCWKPFGQREQICSERVELDVAPGGVAGLAPVLLALAEADLPVVLWCRTPRTLDVAEGLESVLRPGRIVVDSGEAGFAPARLVQVPRAMDLAWIATAEWRQEIEEQRPAEVPIPFGGTAAVYARAWVDMVLRLPVRFEGQWPAPPRAELLARALADGLDDPVFPRVLPVAAAMQK